ncbi:MAG TPA: nickel/cobalt transporter [Methylomirabilota bacterium]|nr:nickel/cobalt transporter [Methylomirabilota bacterium]
MSVIARALPLAVLMLVAAVGSAMATAGPFGVGLAEPAATGGGFLPGVFQTIAAWQSSFYRELTGLISAMKSDGTAAIWLCAFSFAYGVLHAAGPGHGKAIVSAYVLANRETARNGAILAMVSAMAQAVTAIALVFVAAVALGATAMAMTEAAKLFEVGSFAVITGLGAWLTWRKLLRPLAVARAQRFAPVPIRGVTLALAGGDHRDHLHQPHDHHRGGDAHHHDHSHHHHGHHHHHHHGADCDCAHGPTPEQAAGRLDWRKAWTTVLAVGLRPCTGALIVLVFALSQGLLAAGVAATAAMALGTGLTVATLTLAAVSARGLASRLSGEGRTGQLVHSGIEAAGALAILAFGVLMLGASLAA